MKDKKKKWTKKEAMRVIGLYEKGVTHKEIGRILGRTRKAIEVAVSRWARE